MTRPRTPAIPVPSIPLSELIPGDVLTKVSIERAGRVGPWPRQVGIQRRGAPRTRVTIAQTLQMAGGSFNHSGVRRIAVTPRAPHGARGVAADEILVDRRMLTDELAPVALDLLENVLPCLATSKSARVWVNDYPVYDLDIAALRARVAKHREAQS